MRSMLRRIKTVNSTSGAWSRIYSCGLVYGTTNSVQLPVYSTISRARSRTFSLARRLVYGGLAKWMWCSARPRRAMHHAATGLSMPPDSKFSARAAGAYRQTARSLDLGAVDIGGMVADLDHDLQLGVVDIDPQVMVLIQQVGAQFAADLGAFHRVGLVGALGLDLKGAHTAQFLAKVGLGGLADGIKILGALDRTAELDDAEHMGTRRNASSMSGPPPSAR